MNNPITKIIKKVMPAVVSIVISKSLEEIEKKNWERNLNNLIFNFFENLS